MTTDTAGIHVISDEQELREIIGDPVKPEQLYAKISDHLNDVTRQFIERSPYVCVATLDPDGGLDVSPRGDPAGFVRVLDERTLLIPERPGNRIADTFRNLLADPRIGLLFLIPGIDDAFRVNGRAVITDDIELLGAVRGGGQGSEAGPAGHDRGGLPALLQGVDPFRAVEPRPPYRAQRASELRSDSALADQRRLRRRAVRPRARRSLRAARGAVLDSHFVQHVCIDVIDEPPHHLAMRDEL